MIADSRLHGEEGHRIKGRQDAPRGIEGRLGGPIESIQLQRTAVSLAPGLVVGEVDDIRHRARADHVVMTEQMASLDSWAIVSKMLCSISRGLHA
eukprot:scaffold259_cov252-Pinguiococcus_pyrenoidosus.AAC.39